MLLSSGDSFPRLIQKRRSQLGFVTYLLNYLRTFAGLLGVVFLCGRNVHKNKNIGGGGTNGKLIYYTEYQQIDLWKKAFALVRCLSQNCEKQLLTSSCLFVRPPAWNNTATVGRIFVKFYLIILKKKNSKIFKFDRI